MLANGKRQSPRAARRDRRRDAGALRGPPAEYGSDETNALLLKRHTARMNALLCNQGIEKLPDLIEENALLVEQNVILVEQRETDIKSLLRLQEKLDVIHASHADAGRESSAAQAAGG